VDADYGVQIEVFTRRFSIHISRISGSHSLPIRPISPIRGWRFTGLDMHGASSTSFSVDI
jgi:hypothetical protein